MKQVDETDKRILNELQQDNQVTADKLGRLLHLSNSAVQRRLKRLRHEKIIEADISVVSPEVAGLTTTCIVDVSLELGNSRVIDDFKKLLLACPEVMQCYYVAGSFDFVLIVSTRDIKHYEEFSKKYLLDNVQVKQYHTQVVLDKVKVRYGMSL
jgi:Lrp/AsnC family transcriptional regulator, leucine-responsive regulatory protein